MKPILIQHIARKNRKEKIKTEVNLEEASEAANKIFGAVLLILFFLIIGSIAIGA